MESHVEEKRLYFVRPYQAAHGTYRAGNFYHVAEPLASQLVADGFAKTEDELAAETAAKATAALADSET